MSKYRPHFINDHPIEITKKKVKPSKGAIVLKADHNFYIENASGSGTYIFMGGGFLLSLYGFFTLLNRRMIVL
jgi:hypothetical protein